MKHNLNLLEEIVKEEDKKKPSFTKNALVDILGNVTYSIAVGSALDYSAGLSLTGIIASRVSATAINAVTARPYGAYRDLVFRATKTDENSSKARKYAVDLICCDTFQVAVYAAGAIIGTYVSEGQVNWEKVKNGIEYFLTISLVIGPTLGWYMDRVRHLFGIKSAAEKAGDK